MLQNMRSDHPSPEVQPSGLPNTLLQALNFPHQHPLHSPSKSHRMSLFSLPVHSECVYLWRCLPVISFRQSSHATTFFHESAWTAQTASPMILKWTSKNSTSSLGFFREKLNLGIFLRRADYLVFIQIDASSSIGSCRVLFLPPWRCACVSVEHHPTLAFALTKNLGCKPPVALAKLATSAQPLEFLCQRFRWTSQPDHACHLQCSHT